MGLQERYVAFILSHKRAKARGDCKPICVSRVKIYEISVAILAFDLYLVLVLERATVTCFLQLQEMRLLSRNIQ